MKKSIKILCVIIIISVLTFCCCVFNGCKKEQEPQEPTNAKNIILLIGDGMGPNHINAAKIYKEIATLNMETLPYSGYVTTSPKTGLITDSAAAATAMATGKKVMIGAISYDGGKPLKTITEYAMQNGKKTGIVATKDIIDATPAAFSSHAIVRNFEDEIVNSQLESEIDVFIGQGKSIYDPKESIITSKGYTYLSDKASLDAFNGDKLFAMFDSLTPQSETKLNYLTGKALETLNKSNEKGFFLMVEGSKIDSKSHSNEFSGMVDELMEFDLAVKTALEFAQNDKNTLVIVCADHETGDLRLPENATKENLNDDCFHSGSHTGQRIRYFSYGVYADKMPKDIDNTDIFKTMMQAFGFSEDGN